MDAIQRLRTQAYQRGSLASTPEQIVTSQTASDAILILPADPQMLYVPAYNPYYVWGPPQTGAYPRLSYPSETSGYGFGEATAIASLFTGLLNWSGWDGG